MRGAGLLEKTYYHRVSAFRPLADGGETCLYSAVKAALSRSAHTSAPTPPAEANVLPEAAYRLSLFTRPEVWFRLGDRLEVTDEAGRVFRGWASDSVVYPSHCVTVMEVREVRQKQTETEDGTNSRESCPEPARED